jgi:hypothetical protein
LAKYIETTDVFRGAFFICNGGELCGTSFDSRNVVSFKFSGPGLKKLDMKYSSGRALVNPLQFRETVNHLRDVLFKTLDNKRKTENDRKRKTF